MDNTLDMVFHLNYWLQKNKLFCFPLDNVYGPLKPQLGHVYLFPNFRHRSHRMIGIIPHDGQGKRVVPCSLGITAT